MARTVLFVPDPLEVKDDLKISLDFPARQPTTFRDVGAV